MLVINFCGAAGAGKSTAAYGLAHIMKQRYIEVELIDEYAKRLILAGSKHMLDDQLAILAEQNSRLHYASMPANGVQCIVTDSPLFLSAFYAPPLYPDSFKPFVIDMFKRYNSLNIFLERNHPYNPSGRLQTEEESDANSTQMQQMLKENDIPFVVMTAGDDVPMNVLRLAGMDRPPASPLRRRKTDKLVY